MLKHVPMIPFREIHFFENCLKKSTYTNGGVRGHKLFSIGLLLAILTSLSYLSFQKMKGKN